MEQKRHSGRLAAAGLIFLGLVSPERPLIPPALATLAPGYPPKSGTWPRLVVDSDIPDFVTRANNGWLDLCQAGGLFGDDREFLVAIEAHEGESDWWWAHVRLAESWDVMGAGSAAALGSGFGAPEFVMLSLDGDIIAFGMSGNSSIGVVLVDGFRNIAGLRELAFWKVNSPGTPQQEKVAARRWLESITR
ncbi:hypothetical protein [Micromonospora echinofusca]|uniref:SMI1 / KNR4 family (SUKH-1) n=1 Tax=Micromonospora echinofusca TaxID=47858 RepID=A0ABS3VNP5_MICEH|nr:hypothetical protein [Micromonospora echinofusca]MBO4206121.1 hypothetical protein [Micromonospora echinofusca]